jgi:hypothetical protein
MHIHSSTAALSTDSEYPKNAHIKDPGSIEGACIMGPVHQAVF